VPQRFVMGVVNAWDFGQWQCRKPSLLRVLAVLVDACCVVEICVPQTSSHQWRQLYPSTVVDACIAASKPDLP
jgi:hypothetical protein